VKRDEAIFNPRDSRNRALSVDSLFSIQRPLKLCQGRQLVKNTRVAPHGVAPALLRSPAIAVRSDSSRMALKNPSPQPLLSPLGDELRRTHSSRGICHYRDMTTPFAEMLGSYSAIAKLTVVRSCARGRFGRWDDANRPHMTDALRAKILVGIADSLGTGLVRELAEVRDRKLVEC